ncbi:30S ribosomal protein 3, chloroplastic, partial [Cucurbita argyrosperma subsp. argyrosperma]
MEEDQFSLYSTMFEKLGVVVKPMEKPRLVLKFIWMEKNIGIGLDQMIPGHGTIPLSPYYFWPRKDAWEELKVLLESKPWISQKQMIILLNQATDIINLWQQDRKEAELIEIEKQITLAERVVGKQGSRAEERQAGQESSELGADS